MALVVIAEDDADIRHIMLRVIRRGGHDVVEAADGGAALDAVRQHRPQALVTDLDMPVMTGVQVCEAVRADPDLRHLPVIFVSGTLSPGDTRPFDAGATAALTKPFLPRQLLACLDKALATGHHEGQPPAICS